MRIYGGHDYYDCGMAYGQDPAIVLLRKNDNKLDPKSVPAFDGHTLDYFEGKWEQQLKHQHIRVVFCDTVYHGIEFQGHYFWSAEALRKHMSTLRDAYFKVSKVGWREKKRRPLEEFFAPTPISEDLREVMIANRYAILVSVKKNYYGHGEREIFMNPANLKTYEFAKALDPYTAFQNLSMWVGGVLCGQSPEIVTITDNRTILEGHGFDNVFSFRGPRL